MAKTLTLTEKSKKQSDNTKIPPKSSITQRLRIGLGRSVGVTTVNQLVWLNRFMEGKIEVPRDARNSKGP